MENYINHTHDRFDYIYTMNDRFFSKHSQTADRAKSFSLQNLRHESLFKQIYLRSRLNIANFDKTSVLFIIYIWTLDIFAADIGTPDCPVW